MPSLFFSSTVTELKAQDCGISKPVKDIFAAFKNQSDEGSSGDRK